MSLDDLENGRWNIYGDIQPELRKLVLIFRDERKKYCIGRLMEFGSADGKMYYHWVTEYGHCHQAKKEDAWIKIPPYTKQEIYS